MLVTESQAKTKWCPMVRYTVSDVIGDATPPRNRWVSSDDKNLNPSASCCIGRECMMWQWAEAFHEDFGVTPDEGSLGFCGLAGHPLRGR